MLMRKVGGTHTMSGSSGRPTKNPTVLGLPSTPKWIPNSSLLRYPIKSGCVHGRQSFLLLEFPKTTLMSGWPTYFNAKCDYERKIYAQIGAMLSLLETLEAKYFKLQTSSYLQVILTEGLVGSRTQGSFLKFFRGTPALDNLVPSSLRTLLLSCSFITSCLKYETCKNIQDKY